MQFIGKCANIPALLAVCVLAAACGSDSEPGSAGGTAPPLTVAAAASLTEAFETYGEALPGEQRFSFAGSDELAAQIRQGAAPDVFASANTRYPEELAAEGLAAEPVVFARNRLVIAVAPDAAVASIEDLREPGTDLVICARGAPCGDYAGEVLGRLPAPAREAILANVRAEESDVKGVIGKVAQGAADAGLVYSSDVAAAGDRLRAVEIPDRLEPDVAYAAAVLADSAEPGAGREFVAGLLEGAGAEALARAGFLPAP